MAETNDTPDAVSALAPVTRGRHRMFRRLPWVVVALGAAAATAWGVWCAGPRRDCYTAARRETDAIAISVCQRQFERTQDPGTGVLLADAHRRAGNLDVASGLAKSLLATSAQADALQILGKIAVKQDRLGDATELLERARDLHRAANQRGALAKDLQALAGIYRTRMHHAEALRALADCITEARAAKDGLIEGYCHLSAALVLVKVGYFAASQREIDTAEPLMTSARDRAWLETERARLLQELAHSPVPLAQYKLSVQRFERARAFAASAQLSELALTSELNLAYTLAEDHRPDEAARHLEQARILDADNRHASDRDQIAARIAFRRGDLELAWSLNDALYDKLGGDDERLEVCTMQAQIALASNDLALAERWARRGVAMAEAIRDAQTVLQLRPFVLASRRPPYELLFTALARGGRFADALSVFDRWQGRALLDAVAGSRATRSVELLPAAQHLDRLGTWFPAASAAPLMRGDEPPAVNLHGIDLLALAIADGRLWSITARDGELHMADVGAYAALKDRIDQFRSTPDRALGDELGDLLLHGGIARSTRDALRVVVDGPLAGLPVAALRRRGVPLIAIRPIVYAARVSELACVPAGDRSHGAVVLADPSGDLPDARREAELIAPLLGTRSTVGPAATSQALFGATGDVLHVATHAEVDGVGGVLAMYDHAVTALEITARHLGPALVVLSACGSAAVNDVGAGALSTAFLAGGSSQVVATLRPVSDTGARTVTTRFYRDGGVRDPVRVLAQIQASLAETDNRDWPSFAVFGHDICRRNP